MIWDDVRRTFEDYFSRGEFSFEIIHAEDPMPIGLTPVELRDLMLIEGPQVLDDVGVVSP